jgi:hypothetical protein
MGICRRNRNARRKPAPVQLWRPKIPHDLSWDRTPAVIVGIRLISLDFYVIAQLLIRYFWIRQMLEENWEYDGAVHQRFVLFQESLSYIWEGSIVQYSRWVWYTHETSLVNYNVFEWNLYKERISLFFCILLCILLKIFLWRRQHNWLIITPILRC